MPIDVDNPEADTLTRKICAGITDAIVIAMKEAVARRRDAETPHETAARLRRKHGIELGAAATKPLPRAAWDGMWETD